MLESQLWEDVIVDVWESRKHVPKYHVSSSLQNYVSSHLQF